MDLLSGAAATLCAAVIAWIVAQEVRLKKAETKLQVEKEKTTDAEIQDGIVHLDDAGIDAKLTKDLGGANFTKPR